MDEALRTQREFEAAEWKDAPEICDAHVVMALITTHLDICPYEQERYCIAAMQAIAAMQIDHEDYGRACPDCRSDRAAEVDQPER